MPVVSEIPEANALQNQLNQIIKAIESLEVDGSYVPNMTVTPPPPTDPSGTLIMTIGLSLTPPITDRETLLQFQQSLYQQAEIVQQKLVDMGYTDDVTKGRIGGTK